MNANFELHSSRRMGHYGRMTCFRCHQYLPEHAAFCPRCGAAARRAGKKRLGFFLFGIVAVFVLFSLFGARSSVSSHRHSIDIEPFEGETVAPRVSVPQAPPVRFVQPGQRWQPQSSNETVIEFDPKGLSPQETENLKRELAKMMSEKSR
jgi:hypothetical protein